MADISEIGRRVIQSRAGGKVERCHSIPHLGGYSNAAHSWGVAMLLFYLWPEDFARLGIVCLSHDVPEFWVGDIPAPTMRYAPGVKDGVGKLEEVLSADLGLPAEQALSPEDFAKLKACDRLEFWLWAREQELIGNQYVRESINEVQRFFEEVPLPDRAQELYEYLRSSRSNERLLPKFTGVLKALCTA